MTCDPFWKNVSLLIVGESSSGSPDYLAVDESLAANTLTGPGNSGAFVPSVGPFGNACIDLSAYPVIYTPITSGSAIDCSAADFTLEGWFYLNSTTAVPWSIGTSPGSSLLVQFYGGDVYVDCEGNNIDTGATVTTGAWTHVALVQSGNYMTVYVNGVGVAPVNLGRGTWSGNFIIGGFYTSSTNFPGKISNVRLTKGVARYSANFTPPAADFPTCYQAPTPPSGTCDPDFSDVSLLLPFDTFPWQDSSSNGIPIDNFGSSLSTTAQFGAGSCAFTSTSQALQLPVTSGGPLDLSFADDFTVEGWLYFPATPSGGNIFANVDPSSSPLKWSLQIAGGGLSGVYYTSTSEYSAGNTTLSFASATWYSFAFVKYGNVLTVYINGVGGTPTMITSGGDLAAPAILYVNNGPVESGASNILLDEVRITKGLARYTGNYTPAAAAFGGQCTAPVTVPNVVGDTLAAAEDAITAAELTVGTVTTAYTIGVAAGIIASQFPAGGTSASEGSSVDLVESLGSPGIVPLLIGNTGAGATAALTTAGLTVGTVTSAANAAPVGTVFAQSPAASTVVTPGSAVNFSVSLGETTTVPNIVNSSVAVGTSALSAAGLGLGGVTYESNVFINAGNIISQYPTAGTTVYEGTTVSVVVSTGRGGLEAPYVIGDTLAAATTAITTLGLNVNVVSYVPSLTYAAGIVVGQNPSGGTPVAYGSNVGVFVSDGPPVPGVPFDVEATVISQYANSPTILQLVQSMNGYLDQSTNFANFFNFVWNVDTAVGFGLDIWGAIVNVSRLLQIPTTEVYVGFQDGSSSGPGPGWDVQPFGPGGAGTFYVPTAGTESYLLDDSSYRQLILTKALANIVNTTVPAFNQLLQNLFPGRGNPYAVTSGTMEMELIFDFDLTSVELAILQQSGAVPIPPGVSFTITVP